MHPFELREKTVLITGASSGIGRACAIEATGAGARILANGRNSDRLNETIGLMRSALSVACPGDLSDPRFRSVLVESLPPLDGVVHCAGTNQLRPAKLVDEAFLRGALTSNFELPFLLTVEMLKKKKLKRGASVVFIVSIAASIATVGNSAYSAAKAALLGSMRVLALEMAAQSMRANAISPGQVATPMTARTAEHVSPESLAENLKLYPLGLGQPDDVARAAVFLLSDASRWMTGAEMVIDGGYTLR